MTLDVDKLAQEIRRVDGKHSLGAGAFAEALMSFFKEVRNAAFEEAAQAMEERMRQSEAAAEKCTLSQHILENDRRATQYELSADVIRSLKGE